jgi:hypothetical protein
LESSAFALTHVIAIPDVPKCKDGVLEQSGTTITAASTVSAELEMDCCSSLLLIIVAALETTAVKEPRQRVND